MSVRAYKVTTEYKEGEIIRTTHTDKCIFNVWNDARVFDLLSSAGNDMTDQDSCGYLEIDVDSLEEIVNDERDNLTPDLIASFEQLIKEADAKKDDWIVFDCF